MTPEQLAGKIDLPDSFTDIDDDDLSGELSRQPGYYIRTAIKLAGAERDESLAKAARDEKYADLSRQVRENPEKFRVAKLSNEVVDNVVQTHAAYKEAVATYIKAQYLVALLKGAVTALEHKKKSLEGKVYLIGQGLHAAPRVKSEDRKQIFTTDMRKRVKKNQNKAD